MPNYRRARVPGGSFFFTLVVHRRRRILCDVPARPVLTSLLRRCQLRWPFRIDALAILPGHLHAIWMLPPGDEAYPRRWGWIEKEFTQVYLELGGREAAVSEGRRNEGRRGLWPPRYWEHTLETVEDFDAHFDYVHYNPVKHGLVRCPREWPWSTFHRWVRAGVYEEDWACGRHPPPDFRSIEGTVGERMGGESGTA